MDLLSHAKQELESLLHCDAVNVVLYDRGAIETFHKEGGSSQTMKIEGNIMEIARDHYKNHNVAYKEVDLVCKSMKHVMKGVRRGTELSLPSCATLLFATRSTRFSGSSNASTRG